MAEQLVSDQVVGQLINRGCRKTVAGFQGMQQVAAEQHRAGVVHVGVAQVNADTVMAVGVLYRAQASGDFVQRLIPANGLPLSVHFFQGLAQAIRVFMDVLESDRLGADMTATEGILLVALDAENLHAVVLNFETAYRFTQIAGAVVYSRGHRMFSLNIWAQSSLIPRRPAIENA